MPLSSLRQWKPRVGLNCYAVYAPRPWRTRYSKLQWERFKDGYLLEAFCLMVVKLLLDILQLCSTEYVFCAVTSLLWCCKQYLVHLEVKVAVAIDYNDSRYQYSLSFAKLCQSYGAKIWTSKGGSVLLWCALMVQMLLMLAGDVERNPGPMPLTIADLATLHDRLYEIRAKWYSFGLQLGVDVGTLDSIQCEFRNPGDCLMGALRHWLKTHPEPTWKAVIRALQSNSVEENQLAHSFEAEYYSDITPTASSGASSCSVPSQPNVMLKLARYLKMWYKKLSVIPDDPRRQWPPTLGQHYYDLSLLERERELPTTSSVSSYLDSLSRGKASHVSKDCSRIIDLGSMFATSGMASISVSSFSEAKILVTGVPGIGKTTLARKISHEWAIGTLLSNFFLVLLFCLKEERVYRAKDVQDLIGYHSPSLATDVAQTLEETLGVGVLFIFDGWDELPTDLQGSQSIFLDMIHNKVLPNCSVLVTARSYASGDLIKLPSVTKHVEIIGFSSKQITECIRSNIPNPENAEKLLWQLKLQKHIMSACYIPLNFAIVLHVAKFRNYTLPKTLTELYQIFVQNALLRHMKGLPEYKHIKALRYMEDLPAAVQTDFYNLCKLALDGLINEKVTFFHRDISHYFPHMEIDQIPEQDSPFLGLLTSMQSVSEFGEEDQYQFLHVTTQEFLAAWRVAFHSEYTPEAQVDFLKMYRDNPRFYRTFVFLAGLTHFQGANFLPVLSAPVQFSDLTTGAKLSGHRSGGEYILLIAELLYEAQNPEQTAMFASSIQSSRLRIEIAPSSALRSVITVCHFLMSSEKSWNVIEFNYFDAVPTSSGDSPFQFLDKDTFIETSTQVEELKLENFLSLEDIHHLINVPPFTSTKKLTLTRFYKPFDTNLIHTILTERNWVKFGLSLWDASNFNLKTILEVLTHNQSVNAFHLDTMQEEIPLPLDPSCQAALCKLVSLNHALHSLHLKQCGINSEAAKQLSHCLSTQTCLQVVELSDNPLGREGHTAIFQSLIVNTTVSQLVLRRTSDEDEDDNPLQLTNLYRAMIQMFTLNKTLKVLDLSLCSHFDVRIGKWIAAGLKVNRTLEELHLNNIEIPADGILEIFLSLEGNHSLKTLTLQGRRIPHWVHVGGDAARTCTSKMSGFLESLLNLMQTIDKNQHHFRNCDSALCKQIEGNIRDILSTVSQLSDSINNLAKFVNAATENVKLVLVSRVMQNVLQQNKLRVLDLRSCVVYASAIAAGLSKNQSLIELQVGGYPITSDGLVKILESVSQNTTLKKLMLENIKVDDKVLETLIQMLSYNRTLTCFGLYNESDISEAYAQRLLRSLHNNSVLTELILPREFTSFVVPALMELNQIRQSENHPPIQFYCAPYAIDELQSVHLHYIMLKAMRHAHASKQAGKFEKFHWTRRKHH